MGAQQAQEDFNASMAELDEYFNQYEGVDFAELMAEEGNEDQFWGAVSSWGKSLMKKA